MSSFNLNDKIRFMLPDDYIHKTITAEDGSLMTAICADEARDNEGNVCYGFDARASFFEHSPDEFEEGFARDRILDALIARIDKARYIAISDKPKVYLVNKKLFVTVFGVHVDYYSFMCLFQIDWNILTVTVSKRNEGNPNDLIRVLDRLIEVVNSIRISGKKVPIASFEISDAYRALDYNSDTLYGIEDVTGEVIQRTKNDSSGTGFRKTVPNASLYPHYQQLKNKTGSVAPGVFMITNATGTEYEFISLSKAAQNNELPYDERAVYQRAIDIDTGSYDMANRASEIQRLFHVNASVFNEKRDRECEIDQGLLHRAYMMSALRSFAWTLADFCETNSTDPASVPVSTLHEIISFCARKEWLNYRGSSHCNGLCGCSDLHVFYIPDAVSPSDRKKLLPSDELIKREEQRKAALPYYHSILDEVHSLNSLREDLVYIYPAIRALSDELAETRNYNEALTGNEADIVYAWCSLAKAAREPFYVEDGPSNCYFSQIQTGPYVHGTSKPSGGFKARAKTSTISSAASSVSKSLPLDFPNGTKVYPGDDLEIMAGVVTKYNGSEKDIILPTGITEIGEDVFQFSSLHSIVIPEGVKRIGKDAFYSCDKLTHVSLPSSLKEIGERAFHGCLALKRIELPDGLSTIGKNAFHEAGLEEVRIPKSCTVIQDSAFQKCSELSRVVFHDRVKQLKDYSFSDCPKLTGVIIPRKTIIEKYALDDDVGIERINTVQIESASNNAYEGIPNPSESTGFSVSPTGVLNKYTGTSKSKIILPKGIKRVGAGVFGWSYGLKSVIIPEGVTRIDKGAFSHCSFLKSVSFPSTLQAIGEGAFSNTALQDVRFPASLRSIGMSAFSECTSLKTIEFAEGITKIENGAFSKTGLLSVSLPTSLKVLDAFAFSDCEKLKEVVLLGKVDKIECWTFARCKELESLVISEGTKTIASSALAETKQLKDVFLPASVQRIMLSDNDADKSTVFHVPQGSNAEKWCIDQQRKYDNQSYEELVANRIMEQTYSDAMIRMEKGEYTAAKKAFASIPKFRDSAKQVQLCDEKAREQKLERAYSNAKQLIEQEDYAAAKEKFLTLMGYKDSEELVLVCESKHREQQKAREYAKAKEFMDQGDFVRAKETFLTITEYKDSEELVLVCETKHREQQKEIEYQRLVKLEYSAKTPEDWEKLAEEFENLEYNRAASLHADRCRRKAEEVRGQLEEQRIAAQRARERAERRQQLLDERKQLELTLEQYKGLGSLFGEKAKIRKAALARLKEIEDELSKVD